MSRKRWWRHPPSSSAEALAKAGRVQILLSITRVAIQVVSEPYPDSYRELLLIASLFTLLPVLGCALFFVIMETTGIYQDIRIINLIY